MLGLEDVRRVVLLGIRRKGKWPLTRNFFTGEIWRERRKDGVCVCEAEKKEWLCNL